MARAMNFNPGPATLPLEALQRAQHELLDIQGSGMSIIEHSHRGALYSAIHAEAIGLIRRLLGVPDDYHVLFLQGGASQQFAVLPMNLLPPGKSADYIVTGVWGQKALQEAERVGRARAAWTGVADKYRRLPRHDELDLDADAAYVHLTSNNTIAGTQFQSFPDPGSVPLVADMSSDLFWRPLDVSRFGLIYAGAQKNIGPSGVTLVLIHQDLVAAGRQDIPLIFRYKTHADNDSLYNTAPTFSIYLVRNVLAQLEAEGGVAAAERRNRQKAELVYAAIDAQPDLYHCPIERASRSAMNVVFNLPTPEREAKFLAAATQAGMLGLEGHRLVGGVRVSLYNAVPLSWVEALVQFMREYRG